MYYTHTHSHPYTHSPLGAQCHTYKHRVRERCRELMSGNFPAHKIVNLSFYTNTFAEIVFRLFDEKNVMTRMIKVSFLLSLCVCVASLIWFKFIPFNLSMVYLASEVPNRSTQPIINGCLFVIFLFCFIC